MNQKLAAIRKKIKQLPKSDCMHLLPKGLFFDGFTEDHKEYLECCKRKGIKTVNPFDEMMSELFPGGENE